MSASLLRRVAMVALALVVLLSLATHGSAHALLMEFVSRVREWGALGALLYGLVYIGATVALFPGALLTLGAGFLYGPLWGSLLVLIFSVLGASASFLLARSWLRPWVVRKYSSRATFLALDERIREEGWKIVFLLRLSPLVPFAILNYLLGLTSVSLRGYVVASNVGMMPGILLYCYIGSAMASFGDPSAGAGGALSAQRVAFWSGLAATVAVTVVLTRWARRALGGFQSAATPLES
jgi:uncharacterized membrane protein YdjX (TVP38/TMEM64 family)